MFVSTFIPKHSTITIPMYIYIEREPHSEEDLKSQEPDKKIKWGV